MPVSKEYIIKRLALLVLVVFGVLIITFIITRVIPANPALLWAGPHATQQEIKKAAEELHLNDPIYVQLYYYFLNFLRGDWGVSWRTRMPVLHDVLTALPATLELVITAFIIATVVGIPLGVIAALKRGRWPDHVIRVLTVLGASMPVFWLALIAQLIFGTWLHILPATKRVDEILVLETGFHPITGFYLLDALIEHNIPVFLDVLRHLILPALVLSLYPMSLCARMTRALMVEVLNEQFVRAAKAWGLPSRLVTFKYALKNALAPVIASLGLSFGYTIIGAFMVELIFVWPGIGFYAAMSLISLDYPAIVGVIVIVAIFYCVINMIVDIIHAIIDPRVKL